MHRCECVVLSLCYKCQCLLICTYIYINTVNKMNLNLLCGQEVWSEPSTGARIVPANGQTTKTKKIFYMSSWLESLSILLQIHSHAIFVLEKKGGGCASIG